MAANMISRWPMSLRIAALIFSLDAAFTSAQGIDTCPAVPVTETVTASVTVRDAGSDSSTISVVTDSSSNSLGANTVTGSSSITSVASIVTDSASDPSGISTLTDSPSNQSTTDASLSAFTTTSALTVSVTPSPNNTSATNTTSPPTVSSSTPLGVRQTILCIVPTGDQWVASFADICTLGLEGLGISYEVLTFAQAGTPLPTLEQDGYGNYAGIVTLKELSYEYNEPGRTGWLSALTDAQWTALYDYQVKYGVRMARLDVFPTTQFGANVRAPGGSSAAGQLWSFTNLTGFESSGIKEGGTVAMDGLYYYGADVTDAATTYPIAKLHSGPTFTSDATAAVINAFPHANGTREQMVFFTSFAAGWSQASNFIQHSWISWMTRGLYLGQRRAYLGTHIDDVLLTTTIYGTERDFRLRVADVEAHAAWTRDINSRMPPGSDYLIEMAYNGNGNIEEAVQGSYGSDICIPESNVITAPKPILVDQEFKKPFGTGEDAWPPEQTSYTWSEQCEDLDPLATYFTTHLDEFYHVSHTFTHLALSNATFSDVDKEIRFNQIWFNNTGFSGHPKFSPHSLVPPQITGLHNGDAIRAFTGNGITFVVGDNTRPRLLNTEYPFWTLTTTEERNGAAGLEIIPRFATNIYFNCDDAASNTALWQNALGQTTGFDGIMQVERMAAARNLLALRHDPYMFHQANMHAVDTGVVRTGAREYTNLSLLQIWVEELVDEMTRLVSWPIRTLKHDDLGIAFVERRQRDECRPALRMDYSADGNSLVGATVSAADANCQVEIPVTFPGPVRDTKVARSEQLGSDPLTLWVRPGGASVSFELTTPVPVR
ncbi:hypothetical protein FJTKL_01057 [Diaporthe vaccinii]|uniref:Extracellular serine-rich protein n=1 Tax=Diaporthe vaccinii TaxID=105482 RepID=A0ABR4F4V9_9PEZI